MSVAKNVAFQSAKLRTQKSERLTKPGLTPEGHRKSQNTQTAKVPVSVL